MTVLEHEEFVARLQAAIGTVTPELGQSLWLHYQELLRWNRRASLVGPGALAEIVERHYAESLLGVPWLGVPAHESVASHRLLDLGSGAGFPGLVLAAARPEIRVTLVERRQRKAEFLRVAARKMDLVVRVLAETFGENRFVRADEQVDFASFRAVRLADDDWRALASVLRPSGRVLWWCSGPQADPPGFLPVGTVVCPGSVERRILIYERAPTPNQAEPIPS